MMQSCKAALLFSLKMDLCPLSTHLCVFVHLVDSCLCTGPRHCYFAAVSGCFPLHVSLLTVIVMLLTSTSMTCWYRWPGTTADTDIVGVLLPSGGCTRNSSSAYLSTGANARWRQLPFYNLSSLLTFLFFCTTFLPIKLNDRYLNLMYWFALSEIIHNNDHCPAPTVADQGGSLLTVSLLVMRSHVSLYKHTHRVFVSVFIKRALIAPLWLSLELRLSVVVHFDNAGWRSFPFSSHCDVKGGEGEVSLTCQQQQSSVWLCFSSYYHVMILLQGWNDSLPSSSNILTLKHKT